MRRNRARAAPNIARHRVLHDTVAEMLGERLRDVTRRFENALIIGGPDTALREVLAHQCIANVVSIDLATGLAQQVMDEEALVFPENTFDLVIGNLNLQRVNDVVLALSEMLRVLQPGGLLLVTLIGGYSLHELRGCLLAAEAETSGGASPRLHPTISIQDASALLQRTGVLLPVTDQEELMLTYSSVLALLRDLRGMGEGGALAVKPKPLSRGLLRAADAIYHEKFGKDGALPASFDILFLHGWKP